MTARGIARRVHLWLGLSLGLLFLVSAITGSILAFYPELDRALVPALRAVPADSGRTPASGTARCASSGVPAPIRRLYDLIGLAGAPMLLVVVATGVLPAFPDQLRPALARVSPSFRPPSLVVMPRPGERLALDVLAAQARRRFPDAALAWIETPAGPHDAVRINLARPAEPSRAGVSRAPMSGSIHGRGRSWRCGTEIASGRAICCSTGCIRCMAGRRWA